VEEQEGQEKGYQPGPPNGSHQGVSTLVSILGQFLGARPRVPQPRPSPSMFGSNPTRAEHSQDANAPVRQTDSDAAIARLSAVKLGYLQDPFIKFLVQRPHLQPARPPLINIGTYVRSEAIDRLVNEWLELSAVEGKKCQIVSLGAGSDTRFWRIMVRGQFHTLFLFLWVRAVMWRIYPQIDRSSQG